MHYFVVAQGLEYLRATARVLTVYFAPSRLELTPFSLPVRVGVVRDDGGECARGGKL